MVMNKNNRFYPARPPLRGYLAVAALTVFLAGTSGPVSAVLIDDFSAGDTEVFDDTPDSSPVTQTVSGAGIIGESRFLSINLLKLSEQGSDGAASVGSNKYSTSYDVGAFGQSRIVWAGGNDPDSGYMVQAVNLCKGNRFVLRFLSNDQPMIGSYVFRVYSPDGGWSYQPFDVPDDAAWSPPVPPTTPYYDVELLFSAFTAGGGGGANFCNVGRIELFMDTLNMPVPQSNLDMQIDFINVPHNRVPNGVPGINPLGMLIAVLMLALTAVFIERRRSL